MDDDFLCIILKANINKKFVHLLYSFKGAV